MAKHTAVMALAVLTLAALGADRAGAGEGAAPTDEAVAATIIAIEKAALDRWGKGDPDGFLAIIADDYTYFDPSIDQRITGYDAIKPHYEPIRGRIELDRYELIDPKVQVEGNMAVLTFNLKSYVQGPDGSEAERGHWHATEVYRRMGEEWKLVSTHWSFTRTALGKLVESAPPAGAGEGDE